MPAFDRLPLSALHLHDAASYRHISLYERLRQRLIDADQRFLVPPAFSPHARWDRVLFLNLSFWSADSEVLEAPEIEADVLCHVGWHHAARAALPDSADALFLGEAVASAFDVYLVGRLLKNKPDADFLQSQLPRMAEAAEAAGMDNDRFSALVESVCDAPEQAFEDLRALLFDAAIGLRAAQDAQAAAEVLSGLESRRFSCLLHHYELSNWVLFARASGLPPQDPAVRAADQALRAAPDAIAWLETHWL